MKNMEKYQNDIKNLIKLLDDEDGGFSYSLNGENVPDMGFMVSDRPDVEKFVYGNLFNEIMSFLKENVDILTSDGYYLGAWRDPNDFHVGLSVSKHVFSYEKAYEIAKKNNQISFYDLKNKKSIRVKD